jgi:uncharacterized protein YgfB (UPF0149 family)
VACIYRGSRDGWNIEAFRSRVFGQGANLILVKMKQGGIVGGFTTKSWGPSFPSRYTVDNAAFIFNINQRFNQTNGKYSIYLRDNGFEFGNSMFGV